MQAYKKLGLHLAPGMEIGYVVRDAAKWEVDTERDASGLMLCITGSCWKRHGTKLHLCSRIIIDPIHGGHY